MSLYDAFSVLIVLSALFGYLNHRYLKLPSAIGLLIISLIISLSIVILGIFTPVIESNAISAINSIDFYHILMRIMLSFLLFAGAIHLDSSKLGEEKTPIIILTTIGVLISTFIVGTSVYYLVGFFSIDIKYIYCLLFGALISPTDPIAVMSILKKVKLPKQLEVKVVAESLFNDGVAVVVFITIYEISVVGLDNLSFSYVASIFLKEVVGGILWGLFLGYIGYYLLKSIDNYIVEVMLTLSIVMGGYSFAHWLHISGPLAMVVSGIIIGNRGRQYAMSETTRDYLDRFWEIIDELLNAVLFTLIGFEIIVIHKRLDYFEIGLITIVIVLIARYVSVGIPVKLLSFKLEFVKHTVGILTWGGLRGGIAIALALSLSTEMSRDLFVSITYMVVIFSIIVQGLTIEKYLKKII
jgi:monovalent cation:H+ antiporter, CPA1 family